MNNYYGLKCCHSPQWWWLLWSSSETPAERTAAQQWSSWQQQEELTLSHNVLSTGQQLWPCLVKPHTGASSTLLQSWKIPELLRGGGEVDSLSPSLSSLTSNPMPPCPGLTSPQHLPCLTSDAGSRNGWKNVSLNLTFLF